ncbi:NAD-specific glutamate dehydrogenase [Marinobacterium zhoushanense]|uniref:NAD-specific glutamate dehydrogenase n=1 Tax=Marinobacterium zhoushanense TaxID=1679163 RepID=A0ABQ1K5J0_9GAMM|nr:NAD-glutamate dehydrogenase [Marinobacterium zhoushanense]GGB84886.1 NAD-specific glutamate dehydrogenase [Marinobacterium zhoushanense]
MSDSHPEYDNKEQLISRLGENLQVRFPVQEVEAITALARRYYQVIPSDELLQRSLDDLLGITLSAWQFLQQHDLDEPKVRVFNPDFEQHGWQSGHTVIEVLQSDMPFLVDSIRMELNRRELAIHTICNTVLCVQRDQGQLQSILTEAMPEVECRRESLIHLEIDRQSDPEVLKALQQGLLDVLTEVRVAVTDHQPMREGVSQLLESTKSQAGEQAQQTAEFLDWLLDNHFTFLGYDRFEPAAEGSGWQRLPQQALGIQSRQSGDQLLNPTGISDGELLSFSREGRRSRVHRPAHLDVICVQSVDGSGKVRALHRFVGLYTSPVYRRSLTEIPLVRTKAQAVLKRAGFTPDGHSSKELLDILEDLPREELFLASIDELYQIAIGVFDLQERHKVRLLIRRDDCKGFYSCLYYVPRELFNSALRQKIQKVLTEQLQAQEVEFRTRFSDSILARVHFVLRVDPNSTPGCDFKRLERRVIEASRAWDDELKRGLVDVNGEEQGNRLAMHYVQAFPSAYREHFSPRSTLLDIYHLEQLTPSQPVAMSFYRALEPTSEVLRCKLYQAERSIVLSDVLPILEQLGLKVLGEHPYPVQRRDGQRFWLHDFTLTPRGAEPVELEAIKPIVQEAFLRLWHGDAENDPFNRLVLAARLNWREVALLRAYARYSKQLRLGFSQTYIAEALCRYPQIARQLVALFRARFEPARQVSDKVQALAERLEQSILEGLDRVSSLDDDKILRRYLVLIRATLRTNYFRTDEAGLPRGYFSFKLDPSAIPEIPKPRPRFEIFVYSPRVEGVHLRGGKVARGGLRWSDRLEDYRTEVLGLVKAQQVKNAVIVPVGAKGGFVAKRLPDGGDREALLAEGIACYQTFIRGLLDLTDNLVAGELVPPADVVRHDEDDPYLVVAADKGTATFSDIANAIAEEYGFWLGDAFASGGSQGYDHKKMGITARGAWESVKRHFREQGLDTQSESFTVVAIGDMSGDVFGNGMLLSEHIRLAAAFNHQHIFIDPEPDATASFAERQRLFALPRTTWADYAPGLISQGGGVFLRSAKWIEITEPMRERFGITETRLTPNELISALLRSPVDLIWNGGIGTYIKASSETHAEVGDKANDGLRIDARELRCRVLGEGGNLGFTQLGRAEFAALGGACNTDFIDNAGGVDCSDHEVNIKILLNDLVAAGDLTLKQRNRLLAEMTDEVAELVLRNNYRQVQALSLAERHVRHAPDEYLRLIQHLESSGRLDRALEAIPDDAQFAERRDRGPALTRPELSVLLAYAKAELKEELMRATEVTDDRYLGAALATAFPEPLVSAYAEPLLRHRLKPEIVATQLANDMVNTLGPSFANRLRQSTGAGLAQILTAYVISRDLFELPALWRRIEALDNRVPAAVQLDMMSDLVRLARRACRWVLRQPELLRNAADAVERYRQGVAGLSQSLAERLSGEPRQNWQARFDELTGVGVPDDLAGVVAGSDSLYSALAIIEVAAQTGQPLEQVADIYFGLGERLELHWFDQQVKALSADSHWEAMARDSYREELDSQQRALTVSVLQFDQSSADAGRSIEQWLSHHGDALSRWQQMLADLRGVGQKECAVFSVALRELWMLAQRSLAGAG